MKIASRLKDWPEDKPSVEVEYDIPATMDELTARFGADVVYAKAVDSIVIDVQALVRRSVKKEGTDAMTPEQIQAAVTAYKPSASDRVKRSPTEKVQDLTQKMSAEEKKALIEKLKADIKAAAAAPA